MNQFFALHFQYHAEMPSLAVVVDPNFAPFIKDGVLSFCDIHGIYYQYNWDLISYTALTPIEKEKP